ncbi:hypothetical protein [Accumulibacter sp.]|uniref:hypothetical protein n=1 Tax=Accumulibacter sp. TaxID=2053492 RepID=UPI0026370A3D|nr:hypothetical protein [Accumulibacter sp.]
MEKSELRPGHTPNALIWSAIRFVPVVQFLSTAPDRSPLTRSFAIAKQCAKASDAEGPKDQSRMAALGEEVHGTSCKLDGQVPGRYWFD